MAEKRKKIRLGPDESLVLGNNAGLSNVEIVGVVRPSLLDHLRRLFWQLWSGSAAMTCPEHYAGGGWEPGACQGCEMRGHCGR